MTAKKLDYIEIMWGEQHPDVYCGPECNEHKADWWVCGLGDKDGPSGGMDLIELKADTFPAGTKIVISVPLCPKCGDPSDIAFQCKNDKCDCGFDWKEWASNEFS